MSSPEAGRRGPYAKSAARRREILEAGLAVFATGGYRSSSVREIAERVGMSQSGLLHHFSSKEELLVEILAVRDEASRSRTAAAGGGTATLRGVLELVEYNATVPGLVRLHAVLSAEATTPEHPAFRYFRDRYQQTVQMLAAAFAETKAQGLAAATLDPMLEARSLAALMDGLQVQWLLDDQVDMVATVRNHLLKVTFLPL